MFQGKSMLVFDAKKWLYKNTEDKWKCVDGVCQ